MPARRVHIRAPGVKTGSTIGPLGPFRGTLGIHWVLGSIAVGLVIVLAGSFFLFREPGPPFERVEAFTIEQVQPGTSREAFTGIWLGRTRDGQPFAVAHPDDNCLMEFTGGEYVDCNDETYGLDGRSHKSKSLTTVPVQVPRGAVYLNCPPLGRQTCSDLT